MQTSPFNRFGYHRLQNQLGHRKLSHQILGLLLVLTALGSVAWLISSLWNLTIAEMSGLPSLTLWQTLGIMVLIRILSWAIGYPARQASPDAHPPERCPWQSEIPDV